MQKLKRLWRFYKEPILLGGIFVIQILVLTFYIIPSALTNLKTRKAILVQIGNNASLQKNIQTLDGIDTTTLETSFGLTDSALPSVKNVGSMLEPLDFIANKNSVSIISFSVDSVGSIGTESAKVKSGLEQKSGAQTLSATVTVDGTFNQIRSFIGDIQKLQKLMQVKNFDLQFSKLDVMRSQIFIDAYYFVLPKTGVGLSDTVEPLNQKEQELIGKLGSLLTFGSMESASDAATVQGPVIPSHSSDPFSTD